MAQTYGYNRLAELMGCYPSAAIFRRFGSLNMLNLLSLQAELMDLQDRLQRISVRNHDSSDPLEKMCSQSFRTLRESIHGTAADQHDLLLEIRKVLKEYNAALIQAHQLVKLPMPSKADREFIRGWIAGEDEGGNFLQDIELSTWELAPEDDLLDKKALDRDMVMLTASASENDVFSRFLSGSMLNIYHWIWGSRRSTSPNKTTDRYGGAVHYEEESIVRFNNVLVSVIASSLPVTSIVVLYYIDTVLQRIGAVVAFTVAFSASLAVFTGARRFEIFAATSTFAAVEVVFIGTVLSSSS